MTILVAGFLSIETVGELVNIGRLTAFVIVCTAVITLRRRSPELKRSFHTPLMPIVPIVGVVFFLVLIASLPSGTWARFAIWMLIGLEVYFLYSRSHGRLVNERDTGL